MRNLHLIDIYRDRSPQVIRRYGNTGDEGCGVLVVPSPIDKAELRCIASSGEGWEHVSISRANRCPNWTEMDYCKRLFFRDDEVAMQLHVTAADHINIHPYCLHLWRSLNQPIPLPPKEFV